MVLKTKLIGLISVLIQLSSSSDPCQSGDIRLVGGNSSLEGRVEICFGGDWGTVCDDQWDQADASVACKQLGFSKTGAQAYGTAIFGVGQGPIHLDEVMCTGNETNLIECPIKSDCFHAEDAGVRCQIGGVNLLHKGMIIANNSLLSLDALRNTTSTNPLFCVTSLPSCCNPSLGNWFPPNGTIPLGTSSNAARLYQSWGDKNISLNRPNGAAFTVGGLYRCEIPDKDNVMQNIYVGIYSSLIEGVVRVSNLNYMRSSQTLICTSTGGPATSVSWSKDGDPLVVDGIIYQQSPQVIINAVLATYEHRLRLVAKSASLSGMYSCSVTNSRGQATQSTEVIVCRDDEIRLVREAGTTTVQLCMEDQWLNIAPPLLVQATFPVPRNVQIFTNQDGFLLAWDPPLTNQDILSYDVVCTDILQPSGQTISIATLDDETLNATILIRTTHGVVTNYQCCVRAYTAIYAGLMFTTKACRTTSFTYTTEPTTDATTRSISATTNVGATLAAKMYNETPVFAAGGIAGILFIMLLIVVLALVLVIVFHARKHKGDRRSFQDRMSSKRLVHPMTEKHDRKHEETVKKKKRKHHQEGTAEMQDGDEETVKKKKRKHRHEVTAEKQDEHEEIVTGDVPVELQRVDATDLKMSSVGSYGAPVDMSSKLGQSELGQSELGQSELGQSELGRSELGRSELGRSELGQSQLGQSQLGQSQLGQTSQDTYQESDHNEQTGVTSTAADTSEASSYSKHRQTEEEGKELEESDYHTEITREESYRDHTDTTGSKDLFHSSSEPPVGTDVSHGGTDTAAETSEVSHDGTDTAAETSEVSHDVTDTAAETGEVSHDVTDTAAETGEVSHDGTDTTSEERSNSEVDQETNSESDESHVSGSTFFDQTS